MTSKKAKTPRGRVHVVIGDTQVKPGVPTDHLEWIGRYIADRFPDKFPAEDVTIVHLGDHWDMPSLSSYDRTGGTAMEGRRYQADIKAGNEAFRRLCAPLARHNAKQTAEGKAAWWLDCHFLLGNHENRITRAIEDDAQLEGTLSLDDLQVNEGWHVHDFLEPVAIDGITYAHYFYNPNTGKPYGGENLETRLKTIGHTFTMGHQQGKRYAVRPVGRSRHHGLVLGSTYLHDERYLGPQSVAYWHLRSNVRFA